MYSAKCTGARLTVYVYAFIYFESESVILLLYEYKTDLDSFSQYSVLF